MVRLLIVSMLLVTAVVQTAFARSYQTSSDRCAQALIRGGDKPLPLEYEVDLPWSKLDGMWETIGPAPLTFELSADPYFRSVEFRFLDKELYPIAQGLGFAKENKRGVVAYMTVGADRLRVRLGAYMMKSGSGKLREVLVMDLRQFSPDGETISKGMFLMKRVAQTAK